ncbi:Na+/H+ antiporter subunit E [Kocuria koreensis]|uniref:Na+/H+ antiporter subunit E n=1 Tax=Rothia koreensis TaxID=592378 RepID=A0A7K1LJD3_9MICC|nr:Na+/H+ antiporter subunit E [Rothia koreensis]MUN55153.1 Na+/H+ antiporter subunit E [Rothia koreensis]
MSPSAHRAPRVRPKNTLRTELPLIVWLVLVWGALWRDFSVGNLVFGLIIALVIVRIFYLPPVQLSGRFNVFWAAVLMTKFVWWIAHASFEILWFTVRPQGAPRSAVVSVRLRINSDLLITVVGHIVSLIPGSLVVEVDRRTATIYFHVIDVNDEADVRKFQDGVRKIEDLVIRVMGTKESHRALKAGQLGEGTS